MGPLAGIRIVELPAIGPVPFCAMLLAQLGAEVLRLTRPGASDVGLAIDPRFDLMSQGRPSIAVDLKHPDGVAFVREAAAHADALIEGFRPGVMERLGLGPDVVQAGNPALVYGRMTGWGQEGPLSRTAGHDINYLALSGVLHAIGHAGERPAPPLNLVGDFGGGAMMLALGVVAGVLEARRTGTGRLVDAAIVDGASYLATVVHGLIAAGLWRDERGANILDSGAPYYDTYETRDGRHIAVGAIEPKFYRLLLDGLELDPAELPDQDDRSAWPQLRHRLASVFRTRTRDEWAAQFAQTDACVTPVLSMTEAAHHPHARARRAFVVEDGVTRPQVAPRLGSTSPSSETARRTLVRWGVAAEAIDRYVSSGALRE
ncbi:MAG: CoA transferase [Alphaproteobacteria bacterium]|nr:CoA transferase [Alphaproteobacteria bacterium]